MIDHQRECVLKTLLHGFIVNSQSEGGTNHSLDPSTVYVNPYFIVSHYKETALASKHYYMGSQRLASAMIDYWPHGIYDEEGEVGEGDEGSSSGESSGHYSNPNVDGTLINLQNTMNCLSSTEFVQLDWDNLLPWCSWGAGGSQEAMVFSFRRKAENIGSQQSAGSPYYQ